VQLDANRHLHVCREVVLDVSVEDGGLPNATFPPY
jgi:hypothetical protein